MRSRCRPATASGNGWNLSFTGSTQQEQPAINAWPLNNTGVSMTNVDVPGDGRFIVGSRATDNGDGTRHYEKALYNMNSHRSAQGFGVEVPAGVTVANVGFHDVEYHSGEPFSGADWTASNGSGKIVWLTQE